jgi:hypothetical protein
MLRLRINNVLFAFSVGESGQFNLTCRNRLWKEGRPLTVLGTDFHPLL